MTIKNITVANRPYNLQKKTPKIGKVTHMPTMPKIIDNTASFGMYL